ncbi:MAG: hypothetical protein Q9M36_00685 [Sulfurovum sp.]|nr:hypothetical protein [Sulfurovum sp.]
MLSCHCHLTPIVHDWDTVSAGYFYATAIKNDGTLWSWGNNTFGQLGIEATTDKSLPSKIGTATTWKIVSAGNAHTLAIKSDGTLWTWGWNVKWNGAGRLGDRRTINTLSPIQVGTAKTWKTVSAGNEHTLAIKSDGTLWTWGYLGHGRLGVVDETRRNKTSLIQVGSDSDWITVSGGYAQTLAIKSDGTLWAWGYNNYGQLGNGTTSEGITLKTNIK